ncbi:hypothetical protein [Janthinobacterium lividum]|uniref:hypothetical protein n=1 Tax=Janthinobacterium lividum TaxID=29581 RepID=UPI00140CDB73|nr:hypothetical protein [Janthinobacterium lividum]NHQ90523.1 hypothetical protein [Janthinobacterium lividum]
MDTDKTAGNCKGRPNYPADFKRRLAIMLFKWRRDLRADLFEPVASVKMPVLLKPIAMAPPVPHTAEPSGMIEIIIGDAVVRLHAGIDAALLQLVLQSLRL